MKKIIVLMVIITANAAEEKGSTLTSTQQVRALVTVLNQQKAIIALREAEAAVNNANASVNALQTSLCKINETLTLNADNTQVICEPKPKDPVTEKTK